MRPPSAEHKLGPSAKLALTGEILAAYLRVRWRLRGGDLEETLATLRGEPRVASVTDGGQDRRAEGRRLGRAVERVLSRLPTDSRCLMRSLVLLALLERRGIGASLMISVRPDPEFAAHAWVEHAGEPLLPPGSYQRLAEL